MKVIINPHADLRELTEISYKLRYYSKIWKENYGARNREAMQLWENKMDLWLKKNVDDFNIPLTTT